MADRDYAEVLTLLRFDERETILPVGVARVETDEVGRQMIVMRLSLLDRRVFMPLWDVLVLAGIDPKVVGRYLRRRAARGTVSLPGKSA